MKRTSVLKAALASLACLISAAAYADVSPASISPDTAATIDREWKSYIEPLLPLGAKAASLMSNPDDPQQRYELYQQLFKMMSAAYLGMFVGDEAHPDFWPIFNQAYNQGSVNPDNAYYVASLDGRGIYQIKGVRGTVRLIDFQIGSGQFFARGQGGMMPTFNNYDVDDLHVGKDGSFSVILSSERPAGYQGDWWKLDPRSEYVIVRQTAYDWSKEVDGRFGIQRLDTPAIKPRLTPDEIAGNLRKIAIAADNWTRIPTGRLKSYIPDGLINKVEVRDLSKQGGFTKKQWYLEGLIDIAADEALIYETTIPKKCRYWNIVTNDSLGGAVDYVNRQSSLNGHTARIDKDGKFRAVVSASDPGVPNWLDTAGYAQGSLFGRWLQCDSQPTPMVTKVKLADVRKYLPGDTPVVTAAQRDATIRERRLGVQMRRRW